MNVMTLLQLMGGLGLFLYGISAMGDGLEQAAGNRMKKLLEALTKNRFLGMLTGILVTAVIQSSSATTVMVVGFVNAGLLQLSQAIGVIMGANVGTTVTAWVLSLAGIDSGSFFVKLLKPSSSNKPLISLLSATHKSITNSLFLALSANTSNSSNKTLLAKFFLNTKYLINPTESYSSKEIDPITL